MNWKTWTPFVLAAALGIMAAKVGRDVIVRGQSAGVKGGKFVNVVVASGDVEPGELLTEQNLAIGAAPAESVPRGTFKSVAEAAGRVSTSALVKGQTLVETLLAPSGVAPGSAALVPTGMRAVTIDVNESTGVAGLLVPGCRVDLLSSIQDAKLGSMVTRTVVENLKILAVGKRVSPDAAKADDGSAGSAARTITLLVTPRQAEAIELTCNSGRARLVLRGSLDNTSAASDGLTVAELLGHDRPTGASPTKLTQASLDPTSRPALPPQVVQVTPGLDPASGLRRGQNRRVVEVIEGGKTTRVEFEVADVAAANQTAVTGTNQEQAPLPR